MIASLLWLFERRKIQIYFNTSASKFGHGDIETIDITRIGTSKYLFGMTLG